MVTVSLGETVAEFGFLKSAERNSSTRRRTTKFNAAIYPVIRLRNATRLKLRLMDTIVSPGGVMVTMLARDTKVRGFDSRPFHFQVTAFSKLFTHMCLCHQAV